MNLPHRPFRLARRNRLARLLTIAFLVISFAGSLFGQQEMSRLKGSVIDTFGSSIPGARVGLYSAEGSTRLEAASGPDGRFEFSAPPGGYILSIRAEGFAPVERKIYLAGTALELTTELSPTPIAAQVMIASSYLAGTVSSLDEVPGAVDRLDRLTLENSRVFNFSEALRKISGLTIRDEEGFGLRPNIGIRGTNPTRSTKVLLLEDGVPLAYAPYGDNASYYHPPIERYTEVEVLKGSSQIAFGPQTIGGVINYITPNPTDKPSFGVRLTGGNRRFFNGSFTGSGTIGRTGIFAGYNLKLGQGSRVNIDSKLNDLMTKVVQQLNTRNAITLKFSYFGEVSNVTYSGLTESEFEANPRQNPFRNDYFYGDRFGFSVGHSAVISPSITIMTNVYANLFDRDWWRQSSNSGQRPNRLNVDPDCLSMADLNTTCGNEGRLRKYETYGIDPQITYTYNASSSIRGELRGGFRIHWEFQDRRQENGDVPTSRSGIASEINVRRNFAASGFVQNKFVFGRFSVTPGLRIERIKIARTNLLTSPISEGETIVYETIPGIGVAWAGLPRTTIFGGVHRGFSPPRAEDIITNAGGIVELDPERSWNYEAGIRSIPLRGLRFEATFFRLDYQNQIVPASIAGGAGAVLTNGGRTLHQGVEFSGQIDSDKYFNSRHNVFVRTAITLLPIAEFRGTRLSTTTSSALLNLYCPAQRRLTAIQCSISGNRLPYVPKTTAVTSFGYSHAKGLSAFVENVFTSNQFGDDLNAGFPTANGQIGPIRSQVYWNATVNYRIEAWRTTLFVTSKNIADRTFIVDRVRGLLPSSPRLIHAGFSLNF